MKKTKLINSIALLSLSSLAAIPGLTSCGNSLSPHKKSTNEEFTELGFKFEVLSDDTVKLVKYDETKPIGDLVIPTIVKDGTYTVVEIGERALESCTGLTSVYIPNTVTKIGAKAFNYCKKITYIDGCSALKTVGDFAFKSCVALGSITLPEGIETIGDGAFHGCKSLGSISGSSSINVKTIGISAFRECSSLTIMPAMSSLTSIGASAFRDCTSLESFTVEPTCKTIGELALAGTTNLSSLKFTKKTYWSTIGDVEDEKHFAPLADSSACVAEYRKVEQNNLTRYNPITSIALSASSTTPFSGEQVQFAATLNDDATAKKVVWTSSNPTLAPVDENGLVKVSMSATSESFVITASANDGSGFTQTQSLTCQGSPVTKVELTDATCHAICFKTDGSQTFTANVTLKSGITDEKYKKVIWSVDNYDTEEEPLATIDSDTGVLTANDYRVGVVKVTATSAFNPNLHSSYDVCINSVFEIRPYKINETVYRACFGFASNFTSEVNTKINNTWGENDWIQINDTTVNYIAKEAFASVSKTYLKNKNFGGINCTNFDASNLTISQLDPEGACFWKPGISNDSWRVTRAKWPYGITKISAAECYSNTSLIEAVIPQSVVRFGASAFDKCSSLTTLTFTETEENKSQIAVFENNALSGCTSIKNIKFPASLRYFGTQPFYNVVPDYADFSYASGETHKWYAYRNGKKQESIYVEITSDTAANAKKLTSFTASYEWGKA